MAKNSRSKQMEMSIITALDMVLEHARGSELSEDFFKASARGLSFLKKTLGLTDVQIVVLAMLVDADKPLNYGQMARCLGISRLRMMTYTEEVETMVKEKRWFVNRTVRKMGEYSEDFTVAPGVIDALRHNKAFVPENLSGMTNQMFIDRIVSRINSVVGSRDQRFCDDEEWLMFLCRENSDLPLSKVVLNMNGNIHSQTLLFVYVYDYVKCYRNGDMGLSLDDLDEYYSEDREGVFMRQELRDGDHELITNGWLENKCEDGIADPTTFVLSKKAIDTLLAGYKMTSSKHKKGLGDRDLIRWQTIAKKQLFYNEKENEQLVRLRRMLSVEQLTKVQSRLKEKGMRTGVAVLLSGGPGTGKTETVRQLARENGRDLMMVDISAIKSKWVGESEENTKSIFTRYKRLCNEARESGKPMPILFVNEADAVLGQRMEHAEQSVDKMNNAMQNILLQALEDLEGVMICTTNLAGSLDTAFERRFLMKIEFSKPDKDVRAKILRAMMPELSLHEARYLADRFDLSGGQIENIYRKATIDYVISGEKPDLDGLCKYCKEETHHASVGLRPVIGFGKAI